MNTKEVSVFGGECFWCTEVVFKMLKGIDSVCLNLEEKKT